ncbi:hypothetical protein DH2020_031305 [Rehmannia glutinosa]|uniref:Hexosyltransferase n=1 Tax=Rehmannia glutinosa TaxID=99300 RepID=A0ABR0VIA8_REHGL
MQLHISLSLRHVTVLPTKGVREFIKVKIGSRRLSYRMVPEVIYQVLEEPVNQSEVQEGPEIPQTMEDFIAEMKDERPDARPLLSSSKLWSHSLNRGQELQKSKNTYNILAASVVASSLVHNSLHPEKVVIHVITDRKTYYPMQAWFSLHPLTPAIVEVKALHHFDWFTKGKVPVLEAMEKDQKVRSQFRGGSSAIVANNTEKPYIIAAKLQALSPKYNSLMNHIRIYLPELFPSLNKVVFLDDDIVVQTDLSPLWDIDMNGKVNGAVETCRGEDKFVMSKRFKSYLNFSHPLIANNFDPNECAWAYGMNIFDLEAWRGTNISHAYHFWLEENLKSDLSLWQLGTLPPDAESAGVIHFNGRAKPWLDIAFPQLRPLWTKYVDFSDRFIKSCHIRAS